MLVLIPAAWFIATVKTFFFDLLDTVAIEVEGVFPITTQTTHLISIPVRGKPIRPYLPPILVIVKSRFIYRRKVEVRRMVQNVILTEVNDVGVRVLQSGKYLVEHRHVARLAFVVDILAHVVHWL